MSTPEVTPFKVAIHDDELDLLKKKLELARFSKVTETAQWAEDTKVTSKFMQDIVKFWLNEYDWRKEEEKINQMPQFTTAIEHGEFGEFNVHFVHAKSEAKDAIPLIFIHGWPGSFLEVQKILKPLNDAGFHVVAPSLLGYGFSSYTDKAGLTFMDQATIFHKLMLRLGYEKYAVQGGDWGAFVARSVALQFPENARILHTNIVVPASPGAEPRVAQNDFERASMQRTERLRRDEGAYIQMQMTKPRTLGFAMHDSPVGMLAWIADKLFMWTDDYPWTPAEIITWTLLHYFPGPATGFNMYRENVKLAFTPPPSLQASYVKVPFGFSAFAKEISLPSRESVEKGHNLVFWKDHSKGGHFAAWEVPDELVGDIVEFAKKNWN